MNTALRLRRRHALYAVRARLEFQIRVDAASRHTTDNFLIAAVFAFANTQNLDFPAPVLGVSGVHAKQVAAEDSGFVAARSRAYFEKNIGAVIGVGRY